MADKVIINGFCDERFKTVKEVLAKNFEDGLDVGASFAATKYPKNILFIQYFLNESCLQILG